MTPQRNKRTSFCHIFQERDQWYAYDVNTNDLLGIDEVLAAVLPLFGPLDAAGVISRLGPTHGEGTVRAALQEIETARRVEGRFLPDRPGQLAEIRYEDENEAYKSSLSHLTLTVNEQCNLRCGYCLHAANLSWVRPHREGRMSREVALAAVSYFAERCHRSDSPTVSFYGGEPMMRFDLIREIITTSRSRKDWPDLTFVVDTNGTLFSDEVVAFLCDQQVRLQVSLDGPRRVHDQHRRTAKGRPSFDLVEEGVTRLLRRDPSVAGRLSFSVTLAPPFDLPAVVDYFRDFPPYRAVGIEARPFARVSFANLMGVDLPDFDPSAHQRQVTAALAWAEDEYLRVCAARERRNSSPALLSLFDSEIIRFYHRQRSPMGDGPGLLGVCYPGLRRLHVRADGTLQPCERVGESLTIGTCENGIDPAKVDRLFTRFHRGAQSHCRECWAVRMCDLCFAVLAPHEDVEGSYEFPPGLCRAVRSRKESTLKLYARLLAAGNSAAEFLQGTSVS